MSFPPDMEFVWIRTSGKYPAPCTSSLAPSTDDDFEVEGW